MTKRHLALLSLAISTVLLAGCGSSTPETNTDSGTPALDQAENSNEESSSASEIESANEKLGYYIDCINSHSNRALDSYDRYRDWANEETGPTGNEQNIYGLYTLISDVKECTDGIAQAMKMKPAYATLDQAAQSYSKALTELNPLIVEANEYYEEKNYSDDGMAKGKEMHPKLISAFKAFESADKTMRSELETITDELDAKELAMLEEREGRKYPFLTKNLMILAKKVVNTGDVSDNEMIEVEAMKAQIESYEKAVDELKAYDETHKDELGPGIGADSLLRSANDFLVSAKELMRRSRDNVPFETGETMFINNGNAELVEGTPANMIDKYNKLVDAHNFMNF